MSHCGHEFEPTEGQNFPCFREDRLLNPSSDNLDIHDRIWHKRSCKNRQTCEDSSHNISSNGQWRLYSKHNCHHPRLFDSDSLIESNPGSDSLMNLGSDSLIESNFDSTIRQKSSKCIVSSSTSHNQHSFNVSSSHESNSNHSANSNYSTNSNLSTSPYLYHFLVLVLLTVAQCADGCSSRSTPKPRPPSHSAMARPNITFQTYACPPAYAAWYCLNGATCFTVKIADSILYNCECADGYMGQRCEFKDLDGTYLPTRERLLMGMGLVGSTSKVGPVFLAVFFIILAAGVVSFIVTRTRTKAKKARIIKQQTSSDTISHLDSISSPSACSVLSLGSTGSSPMGVSGLHSGSSGYYCSTPTLNTDMTVLGQSISYSLSHQRYPYLANYQGAELRSIHRQHDNNRSMIVSSRIPAKHLNHTR